MPRYSLPYQQFLKRIEEVEILRRSAMTLERRRPLQSRSEINALCRAGIVLLTSHIEGYVKDIGEVALDSVVSKAVPKRKFDSHFFYHISKKKIDTIKSTNDPDRLAHHIRNFIKDDLDYWHGMEAFTSPIPVSIFNDGFSTPSFDKVGGYLRRFGYTDFRRDFFVSLRANGVILENALNNIVDTRNSIAHGDMNQQRTPQDFTSMIDSSKLFCRTVDDLFCKWFRNKYCSIRG